MHSHRFVEIKIASLFFYAVLVIQEIDALQHIGLFDERGSQDFIP